MFRVVSGFVPCDIKIVIIQIFTLRTELFLALLLVLMNQRDASNKRNDNEYNSDDEPNSPTGDDLG